MLKKNQGMKQTNVLNPRATNVGSCALRTEILHARVCGYLKPRRDPDSVHFPGTHRSLGMGKILGLHKQSVVFSSVRSDLRGKTLATG